MSQPFRKSLLLLLAAGAIMQCAIADSPEKELGTRLKARYKGVRVSVMVAGFYAGEFKKSMQAREDFVNWRHYHEGLSFKPEKNVLDQIDDRTVAVPPLFGGGNGLGSNVFPVEKGEALLASNTIFHCAREMCTFTLFLDTMKLSKTTALDPRKETRGMPGFESAGLGCTFTFAFTRETIGQPKAEDLIVATVAKYLQPTDQAEKTLKAARNIEIDIGATEDEVIQKLGEPLKTVRVGSQKTLKYAEMTIILKDGKVADVKVE